MLYPRDCPKCHGDVDRRHEPVRRGNGIEFLECYVCMSCGRDETPEAWRARRRIATAPATSRKAHGG